MRCYRSKATADNYPVVLHFTAYQSGSEGAGWIHATSGETNLETAILTLFNKLDMSEYHVSNLEKCSMKTSSSMT